MGEKIRKYLEENGIKYSSVAEKTDIQRQSFYDILHGKRKIDAVEYFKICEVLNLPLEYFKPVA